MTESRTIGFYVDREFRPLVGRWIRSPWGRDSGSDVFRCETGGDPVGRRSRPSVVLNPVCSVYFLSSDAREVDVPAPGVSGVKTSRPTCKSPKTMGDSRLGDLTNVLSPLIS